MRPFWYGHDKERVETVVTDKLDKLDAQRLSDNLEALFSYVQRVRTEIASLNQSGDGEDKFATMGEQLDGVVEATKDASDSIMEAIEKAGPFEKPFVFFSHLDPEIALATAQSFVPAIPLDMPSLVFGGVGIVLGWMVWEVIKAPAALFRRKGKRVRAV